VDPDLLAAGPPAPWEDDDRPVPEVPAELLDAPPWDEPPCECTCCTGEVDAPEAPSLHRSGAPASAIERFREHHRAVQRETALMWQSIAALVDTVGPAQAEFVSDDLALEMRVHPRSAQPVVFTALEAVQFPALMRAMSDGEICDKHVQAVLEEARRWTSDEQTARDVVEQTLARCQDRLARGLGWPTPAQLRKRVRTVAMLLDLTAAETAKKNAIEARGVSLSPIGVGRGQVVIEGPDVSVSRIMDAIRARAEALGRLPGNGRTLDQRMFDAAEELLTVDTDGGQSAVPTLGEDGEPVTIRLRGMDVSVLIPFSVAAGGDLEVAEIVGYGPILPSTARELLADTDRVRRVAVDADSGRILAIDEHLPGPTSDQARADQPTTDQPTAPLTDDLDADDEPDDDGDDDGDAGVGDGGDEGGGSPRPPGSPPTGSDPLSQTGLDPEPDPAPAPEPAAAPWPFARPQPDPARPPGQQRDREPSGAPGPMARFLRRLTTRPVIIRELSTPSYRVPGRLRRRIELRDRTCQFPGCTVPGRWCDMDHRDAWPHGPTDEQNVHCLCRRHHRAKQIYFHLELTPDGGTIWVTPDGRRYRTPAPFF